MIAQPAAGGAEKKRPDMTHVLEGRECPGMHPDVREVGVSVYAEDGVIVVTARTYCEKMIVLKSRRGAGIAETLRWHGKMVCSMGREYGAATALINRAYLYPGGEGMRVRMHASAEKMPPAEGALAKEMARRTSF